MPEDQASLLTKIAEAEQQWKVSSIISVPGCSDEIEYD
ncbi:hypothetical protein J2741_000277 [Methanolinea mesophila]|nr:hypothetical protein [Methanolinea mesophila]